MCLGFRKVGMFGDEDVFKEGRFGNLATIYNLFFHTLSPYQTSGTISLNKMELKGPKLPL